MASEFYQAYRNRHQLAEGWKQAGRNVFGYFCNYTPEELVYSAGIIPVRIRGSAENIDLADAHLPSFCCSYMRSALDQALKGRYSYLDGAIFPKTCDMTRSLYGIWRRNIELPYYWSLPVPGKSTDEAVDFFTQELGLFKESLEGYTNQGISEGSLQQAIRVYNENRSLVNKVYELALRDTPPLSGSEVFGIVSAGLIMPKEQHNVMLRDLLKKLPDVSVPSEKKVRLMLAGNNFEHVELIQAIEDSGADVVIDDLDTGTRYYGGAVDETIEPLKAIAERYLRKIPCPCKHPAEPRLEHMLELATTYRVNGVILLIQKYCDTHLYDRPWIESRLKEEGFPVLYVEHSDTGWSGGKFKTMVQAFIEMLE
jgi:benzoyl-CoA reductase subunit C